MKYVCNVKEISYGTIEVEANSPRKHRTRQKRSIKTATPFGQAANMKLKPKNRKQRIKSLNEVMPDE